MIYEYYNTDQLVNKPIWAFAYDFNNELNGARLICPPILGELANDGKFYEYKKGTTEKKKSGAVSRQSRMYADTYAEAVNGYNQLIQNRIDQLNGMIAEAEAKKIKP